MARTELRLSAPEWLALGLFALWAGLVLVFHPMTRDDTWFHLKSGEVLWRLGHFPSHDLFSYSSPLTTWPRMSWLYDLLAWGLWRWSGLGGLMAFNVLAALGIFTLALGLALEGGSGLPVALALGSLMLWVSRVYFSLRPQVAAYLCFMGALWLLGRPRDRWRWLGILAVSLAWANLHGSVVILAPVVAAHEAGAWWRGGRARPAGSTAAVAAALAGSLVNPDFAGIYFKVLGFLGSGSYYAHYVLEWRAPPLGSAYWLLALAGGTWAAFTLARRPGRRGEAAVLLLLAAGSLGSMRLLAFFCLAAAAWMPRWVAVPDGRSRGAAWWPALLLGVELAFFPVHMALLAGRATGMAVDREYCPIRCAEFLWRHPPKGRLGNLYEDGAYLLWRLYPRVKVFVDSRELNYPVSVLKDAAAIKRVEPGWRGILRKYGMSCFLVPRHDPDMGGSQALAAGLMADPHWRLAYFDPDYLLFADKAELEAQKGAWPWYRGVDPLTGRVSGADRNTVALLEARMREQGPDAEGLQLLSQALRQTGHAGAARAAALLARRMDPKPDGPSQ